MNEQSSNNLKSNQMTTSEGRIDLMSLGEIGSQMYDNFFSLFARIYGIFIDGVYEKYLFVSPTATYDSKFMFLVTKQ